VVCLQAGAEHREQCLSEQRENGVALPGDVASDLVLVVGDVIKNSSAPGQLI
jgi:hypothetical protein